MKRMLETAVFVSLALCAHVALFVQKPPAGSEAGGVGGAALVSLAGATPQIAAMVETWEQPPDAAQQPDRLTMPMPMLAESAPSDVAQVDLPVASDAPIRLPVSEPTARAGLPQVETTTPPPPPPKPAAISETVPRPPNQPERPAPSGTAQVSQAGRAAQRAAGTGGKQQAGQAGNAQSSTLSPGKAAQLQAVWGAQIRSRIERGKRFPSGASGSGRVVVMITIARSGRMLGYQVRTSSGSNAFDTSAMQAVAQATRLPAAPPELTAPQYSFVLPIVFSR